MDTIFQIGLSNSVAALLLAAVAAIVGLRGRRPALAHALWVLVLVKLITPPLFWLDLTRNKLAQASPEPGQAPQLVTGSPCRTSVQAGQSVALGQAVPRLMFGSPAPPSAPTQPRELPGTFATWVTPSSRLLAVGVCLALAVSWWAWVTWHVAGFLRLLRWARPAPEQVQNRARLLARQLGLRHAPEAWFVSSRVSPMLWSIGRPRLLLPGALWGQLTPEQADALLVHELAHYRRRDHWVRWLEIVVTGLYWWNPLLWWTRRSLHAAEEQCCDAWVVRTLPASSEAYARAILATADYIGETTDPTPLASTRLTSATELRRRLVRILDGSRSAPIWRPGMVVLSGLAAAILAMGPSYARRPSFRATPIDGLGREGEVGYGLQASALNDLGQVAGGWANQDPRYPHLANYQVWHPFRTLAGQAVVTAKTADLSELFVEQQRTWVKGMLARLNNSGHMLIHFNAQVDREIDPDWRSQISRGILIDGLRVLDLAPGMDTETAAINDAGQIAGTAIVQHDWTAAQKRSASYRRFPPPRSQVAFRIPPGRPLDLSRDDLGHLGGPKAQVGTHFTRAAGINALGQVVGTSIVGTSPVPSTTGAVGHAFRTAPNQPINPLTDDLGAFEPDLGSEGRAINDLGQAAGIAYKATPRHGAQRRAFRTGPNQPINPLTDDLGTLPGGIWSEASDINNRGDVVGTAEVDAVTRHAFLYTGQTMFDLNDCVDVAPGWHLEEAFDLTDSGAMLALASSGSPGLQQRRSYLLTPAPEPVSMFALLLGMAAVGSGALLRTVARKVAAMRLRAISRAIADVPSRFTGKGGDGPGT
jgi:probable HAF family extracellular repeat protein